MPHDAFGNRIDGDPLAGLGSGAAGSHRQGMPGGRPPRRGIGIVAVLVLAVVVIAAAAGVFIFLAEPGDDPSAPTTPTSAAAEEPVPEEPAREEPADPDPPAAAEKPAVPATPAAPPTGLQRGSLLRRANLTVALRRVRAQAKGLPRNVRVAAERVDVQLVLRDGRLRSAQATWDGDVRIVSTTPTPIGGLEGFAWSRIDRGAPQRIVRSATGRARKPASAFDYAVLLDVAGLRWSAFLKSGEGFIAGPSGQVQRQISG